MNRPDTLKRVRDRTEPWDVIVIGGGATGIGCALDAASRGYDVLLLEQHDLGKGTSSRSTKLIHGGVRYLRQGNIGLVRESLRERAALLRNAPHVVHKQPFVVPCYSRWQKVFYGAGLKIYDMLAGGDGLGSSRILSAADTCELLPNIEPDGLRGGVLYYDGQFDDTRLLIDLAHSAYGHGAAILNYTPVTSIVKNADGLAAGVAFEDVESGERFTAEARSVINAAGIFSDHLRSMSDEGATPVLSFSQGIHLVLDKRFLDGGNAIMIPQTDDGRILFCIPWMGHTLLGTTDTPVDSARLEPVALRSEIDFVLDTAGRYLADKPGLNDVMSVFAGIRPLINTSKVTRTSSISRGHELIVDDAGLVTITGGKWTTYRQMAEDAVDRAALVGGLVRRPSLTADIRIAGQENTSRTAGIEPLHPDLPYTVDDIERAVRHEMARTLEDVLARRTRALFLNAAAAAAMAPGVAAIIANELGHDTAWADDQVAQFTQLIQIYQMGPIHPDSGN